VIGSCLPGSRAEATKSGETGAVLVVATLDAPCAAPDLFGLVDELDQYPSWMPLAHHVTRLGDGQPGGPGATGSRPAWSVELRARVGPFARSKRLRMVRAAHDPATWRARFERSELDGRTHAAWVLDVAVDPVGADSERSRLTMHLHYSGSLWTGGVMERVLADQIESGRERLLTLVANAA
jgi:hypothetical protein